jgi:uncharacterized protein (TIGR03382 family)
LDVFVQLSAREVSLSPSQLGLTAEGDTAYVYIQAYDQAFVSDPLGGNPGELSESVEVTFVNTVGFCDAPGNYCSGCSASPMMMAAEGPSSVLAVLGVLFALGFARRRQR